ncbi:hypothetical protein K491DRAFT_75711 [Lophiostoma macrostomum CBS 122681]|uniref:Uncharacterized protein n=1 Tax=Lophiostoma macrostomum CBS 122681 TaxID=1314788 RepID=A0A6A6T006_9PLEO|nr:hypothetical protein K491DRAFT_75711 [Lophiostoma macrostomum CBS 122681]
MSDKPKIPCTWNTAAFGPSPAHRAHHVKAWSCVKKKRSPTSTTTGLYTSATVISKSISKALQSSTGAQHPAVLTTTTSHKTIPSFKEAKSCSDMFKFPYLPSIQPRNLQNLPSLYPRCRCHPYPKPGRFDQEDSLLVIPHHSFHFPPGTHIHTSSPLTL